MSYARALTLPRPLGTLQQLRQSRLLLGALLALGSVELVVSLLVAANIALYAALVLLAALMAVIVLRRPRSIVYVSLFWIIFEKSIRDFGNLNPSATTLASNIGDGFLVLGVLLAVIVNLSRGTRPVLRIGPILLGGGAFVCIGIASTISNSVPPSVAGLGLLDSIRAVLMFLIVINIGMTARDGRRLAFWVLGVMAVSALVGVLQIVPSSPAWKLGGAKFIAFHGLARVDGLFDHPTSLADFLALTAPLALIVFLRGNVKGRARVWLGGALAVMFIALIFTLSREAWIAVPLSLIVVGIFVERKLLPIVLPVAIGLGLCVAPFFSSVNSSDSGGQRLTLLKLTWPLIKSHWLIGVGPGRYGGHVALVTNTPLYAEYHVTNFFYGTGNQIDQFWTHLLAESGVLGVAAFLMMMIACFIVGRRAYLDSVDPMRRAVILGLLCAVPSAITMSFVSSVLEEGPASVLFWGFMGILVVFSLDPEQPAWALPRRKSPWESRPSMAPDSTMANP